jgi:hypothetical protein
VDGENMKDLNMKTVGTWKLGALILEKAKTQINFENSLDLLS